MRSAEAISRPNVQRLCICFAFLALMASSGVVGAMEKDSLAGLWMIRDQSSGEPRALIRIAEQNGEYRGTVEKGLRGPGSESPYCDKCEGELQGRPLLGMTILSGVTRQGQDYRCGKILDPESGRSYDCRLTFKEQGRQLEVRGYIGSPMFGRSQTWERVEE